MRELLDSTSKRRLLILERLSHSEKWISSQELADLCQASLRTINNDIHYLRENWSPTLLIETSKKNGVRLITPSTSQFHHIYTQTLKKSDTFRFIEEIFYEPTQSLDYWVEKLFISESSLYRISNQINRSLMRSNIRFSKRPCCLTSKNESDVRYFYTTYFTELYSMVDWPFALDAKKTLDFIECYLQAKNFPADDLELQSFSFLLAISAIRFQQGFFEVATEPAVSPSELPDALIFDQVKEQLAEILEPLGITNLEAFWIDINHTYYFSPLNCPPADLAAIHAVMQSFIQYIQAVLDLTIQPRDYQNLTSILTQIYLYDRKHPYPHYLLFNTYSYNARTIQSQFPIFTGVIDTGLEALGKALDFPQIDRYRSNFYCWLFFRWHDLPCQIDQLKKRCRTLILSNLGHDHAALLASLVRRNFGDKVEVVSSNKNSLFFDHEDVQFAEEFDTVIANFEIPTLASTKLLVFDDIPSNRNWGALRVQIQQSNILSKDYLNVALEPEKLKIIQALPKERVQ